MKVTGFSFLKNAVLYEYPVVEAIKSILPVCDEFVIAIGKCDDGSLELIQAMGEEKIRIIETEWDDSLKEGGRVLADETNKALKHISKDTDWAFYIQADEIIHEKYLDMISEAMIQYKDNPHVDGLLFKYLHFYGSFDYVGASSNWYTHEIRIIKNNTSFYSYKDAQGFRKDDSKKLNVVPIDAYVYHYGWVRKPDAMQRKQTNFGTLYRGNESKESIVVSETFDYESHVREIKPFQGTHPKVMKERIRNQNWTFDYNIAMSKKSTKDSVKHILKKYLGWDMNYRNYKIINPKISK
ncbi:glycosyltransferase family 2 protein [Muricauda sp. SCSIO 64092]|uniref:glycosyltransferase family 2 protein n=1 Tax=Allomuricauda sp. SCSIO 64092 TaxID=2908842 RepID=UPI001FF6A83D|nr:glycosyltransferase family 2 protein [Muricauda sp. SCSIO 64092]UOY04701.1 glycosyltransferase family 2 protein [Muricauda sp. SCSIO 64092]